MFDVEGALFLFFTKTARTNKIAIKYEANRDMSNKNMTEILKNQLYAPENNLLRNKEESFLQEKINGLTLSKISDDIGITFDSIK